MSGQTGHCGPHCGAGDEVDDEAGESAAEVVYSVEHRVGEIAVLEGCVSLDRQPVHRGGQAGKALSEGRDADDLSDRLCMRI